MWISLNAKQLGINYFLEWLKWSNNIQTLNELNTLRKWELCTTSFCIFDAMLVYTVNHNFFALNTWKLRWNFKRFLHIYTFVGNWLLWLLNCWSVFWGKCFHLKSSRTSPSSMVKCKPRRSSNSTVILIFINSQLGKVEVVNRLGLYFCILLASNYC